MVWGSSEPAPLQSPVIVSCGDSPFGGRLRQTLHNSDTWLCPALQLGTEGWSQPPGEAAPLQAAHPRQPLGSQHGCFPRGQAQRGAQHGRWGSQDWEPVGSDRAQKTMQLPAAGTHAPGAKILTGRASRKLSAFCCPILLPRGVLVGEGRERETPWAVTCFAVGGLPAEALLQVTTSNSVSYFKQST